MLLAASMAAAMFTGSAQAVVLYESDPYLTTAIGAAAPLGITPSLGSENGGYGGGLLTSPIGFETDGPTKLTITVKDLGFTFAESTEDEDSVDKVDLLPNLVPNGEVQPVELSLPGSRYEVILDGESLGTTSEPGVNGWSFSFSEGVFHANVGGGSHTLDLWNFVLTFAPDFFPIEAQPLSLDTSFATLSSSDEQCLDGCDLEFLDDLLGSNVYVKIEATAPIPEPSTYATLALGLIALAVAMARRQGQAAASAH